MLDDVVMPFATIPDLLRYSFNLTCLMDSGRYCNQVAAAAAGAGATVAACEISERRRL
jgi:hypothetical protein